MLCRKLLNYANGKCYGHQVVAIFSLYCSSMTSTKFSISEVHRRTGFSRTTIRKHIKDRKLSSDQDDNGKVLLDSSELERVYGKRWTDSFANSSPTIKSSSKRTTDQNVQHEVDSLQKQLAKEIAERDRERAHYREQIDHLQDALKLAQEGQNSMTKLLEDRSTRRGGWEMVTKSLQEQIANQQSALEERINGIQEEMQQAANKHWKHKYWWQLLIRRNTE